MGRRSRRTRAEESLRLVRLWAILGLLAAAVLITAAVRLSCRPSPAEAEEQIPAYITRDFLPVNPWSRPGDPLKRVNGVVLHYVGNPATSAQANRNYFASLSSGEAGTYASSHFIVGLEGEVVQCVPLTEIAYASNSRNDDTVSIEVCHPDETGAFSRPAYDRCVELTAWLCRVFRLRPGEDVIRHYDVTGKLCPRYFVEDPEAWDAFLEDVSAAVETLEAAEREAADNS